MSDLARALAELDLGAYPPQTQAYLLAVLSSMAAGADGVNVATSVDGSPLPPGIAGDLNIAIFQGLPPGVVLPAFYSVGVLQGSGPATLGGSGNQLLVADAAGNDALLGQGYNDTVVAGSGNDTLFGGAGTAVITSGNGPAASGGGAVLVNAANSGSDIFYDDTVFAFGHVLASAGLTNLFFINGANSSTVIGGGAVGRAIIDGGAGGGMFQGNAAGNNVLYGGTGASTLFGGGNGDLLLAGGANADLLIAGYGNETLSGLGSTGANTFYGGGGSDLMGGGSGNQTFIAGQSNATMIGGSGNDTFVGGVGQTTMIGGGGIDLFEFNNTLAGSDPLFNFGGTADIYGFTAADKVVLEDYSSGAVSNALEQAVIAGGSTTIKLPDSTTILFQGVTNLTGSAFA